MDKEFIKNPVEAYEKLKEENKSLKESLKLISQTLNHTLQSEVDLYKRQIDNSVPDDWEYEEVLALVEEYIEKLKAENEKLKEEINQLKAENETYKKMLEDEEVILALNEARTGERHLWFNKAEKYKQTLTEIKEIVCLELAYGTNEEYANFYMQQREAILLKIGECEGDNEV